MRLLDAHPEAACSGEGHYFDRLRPLFVRVFQEYQHLLDLDSKLVFSGKPVLEPIRISHVDSLIRHFVLERFAEHDPEGRARAHGDKTPGNWKDVEALFSAFPEAMLVFINRDPRDVAVSLFGHAKRRQILKLDPEGPLDREKLIRAACRNWLGANRMLQNMREQRADRLTALRYEDLLEDPVGEFGQVCRDLGLQDDSAILRSVVDACSFSRLSGRKRGEWDPSSFFTSGTSGSWKKVLTADEAGLVVKLCSGPMETAGYGV